jgi:hypothetical protein
VREITSELVQIETTDVGFRSMQNHQMLTYLTSKGLSDAQIQLTSDHKTKKSLEVYQHLWLQAVESAYQEAVHSLNI